MDYPIVFSNDGFCKMTGFNRADCMQRSSTINFMYGELTNQDGVKTAQEAFEKQEAVQVELLIYKKSSKSGDYGMGIKDYNRRILAPQHK